MNKVIPLLLVFSCVSCGAQEANESVIDNVRIGGLQLTVIESNGTCLLQIQNNDAPKSITLAPKPPCFFLRRGSSDPQQFEYPDVGVEATLIVAGSLITKVQREEWGLSTNQLCGTERQGILIYKNEVHATENVLKGGVACKEKGSDEKDFWFFAHKR